MSKKINRNDSFMAAVQLDQRRQHQIRNQIGTINRILKGGSYDEEMRILQENLARVQQERDFLKNGPIRAVEAPLEEAVIHIGLPGDKYVSFCGDPVTIITQNGDTRPICQACYRGAMKNRWEQIQELTNQAVRTVNHLLSEHRLLAEITVPRPETDGPFHPAKVAVRRTTPEELKNKVTVLYPEDREDLPCPGVGLETEEGTEE